VGRRKRGERKTKKAETLLFEGKGGRGSLSHKGGKRGKVSKGKKKAGRLFISEGKEEKRESFGCPT